jgi:STE24 endopeptidase
LKLRPALSTWQWTFGSLALTLMCVWLSTFPQAQAATLLTGTAHFAATEPAGKPAPQNVNAAYSLPPEKLAKAIRLSRDYTILQFAQQAWEILFLLLLLGTRVLSRLGNWAETITRRRWLQGLIFLPILLLMMSVSHLPFSMTSHWLSVSYGLSVQHWGSWFLDHGKSLLLTLAVGTFILSILLWLIRKFPQRWWVLFWVGSIPFVVFTVFVIPVLIDPIFNHFEPLTKSNPALVSDLERVVARTGTNIPPERMFLMKASEKLTVPNAYVTGIGATKRVVVWDTTIKMAPTDDILFIFGHESGHYVLNHIWKGIAFYSGMMLVLLWIGYHMVNWLIARFGERWHVGSIQDWAAVGVLLVAFSVLSFLSDPIGNTYSRSQEHDADIYGQEALHGIVANPQATAQQSFQLLGESYLEDPNPAAFLEFWTYDHPSTAHRADFSAGYNPWVDGQQPKYFPKENAK